MRWSPLLLFLVLACDDGDGEQVEGEPQTPGDTYVAGLEKVGPAGLKTRLLDALPAPPERGDNTWTLEVLGPDGQPLEGCELVFTPDMPAHGHGTWKTVETSVMDAPGTYRADPVFMFMPGLWVVPIDLTCGALTDRVEYAFWIEG